MWVSRLVPRLASRHAPGDASSTRPLGPGRLRDSTVDEDQSDAAKSETDRADTGDDEVDAQQLLSAAARAIAAVRSQAAGLLQHHRELRGDDEQPEEGAD